MFKLSKNKGKGKLYLSHQLCVCVSNKKYNRTDKKLICIEKISNFPPVIFLFWPLFCFLKISKQTKMYYHIMCIISLKMVKTSQVAFLFLCFLVMGITCIKKQVITTTYTYTCITNSNGLRIISFFFPNFSPRKFKSREQVGMVKLTN